MKKVNEKALSHVSRCNACVSAIVLSSATYAWFSLGTTARVSQLNFSLICKRYQCLGQWYKVLFSPDK
jgi:heterodisulfide reductase subunit B